MDYMTLLASLAQFLTSRLAFENAGFINELQQVLSQFVGTGNLGNSGLGTAIARVYEQDARRRAELVIEVLRQSRTSWSPRQIVDAQSDIRTTTTKIFTQNLSEAASLAEQVGHIQGKRQDPRHASIVQSFLSYTDQASKAAMSMVDAVVSEIVAAAQNELSAKAPTDRPSYVFQTFQGPVGSIAQGNASVGSVSQKIGFTPDDLADAVAAIIRALPTGQSMAKEIDETKEGLAAIETELRAGKIPFGRLRRILGTLSRVEDIATKAPEAFQHIYNLAEMLGFAG